MFLEVLFVWILIEQENGIAQQSELKQSVRLPEIRAIIWDRIDVTLNRMFWAAVWRWPSGTELLRTVINYSSHWGADNSCQGDVQPGRLLRGPQCSLPPEQSWLWGHSSPSGSGPAPPRYVTHCGPLVRFSLAPTKLWPFGLGSEGSQQCCWGDAGIGILLSKALGLQDVQTELMVSMLTGDLFRFLADSVCKGDEWLPFRLLVTKTTQRLLE